MVEKLNKYLVSADLIITFLILSIAITFLLCSKIKEKIGVLYEKVTYLEDEIEKMRDERYLTYHNIVTRNK